MDLISEKRGVVNWRKPFEGEIDDDNHAIWGRIKDKKYKSPDEDANDKYGTYLSSKATRKGQKPVTRSRKRPLDATYQSVVSLQ